MHLKAGQLKSFWLLLTDEMKAGVGVDSGGQNILHLFLEPALHRSTVRPMQEKETAVTTAWKRQSCKDS